MAVTNEQILSWLQANPNATDAQIAQQAATSGVSAQQLAQVTGLSADQINARATAANPSMQLPAYVAPAAAPAPVQNTWNYDEYYNALKTGGNLGEQVQRLATQNPTLAANASTLFNEIAAQQKAGTADSWYKGNTASIESAAADFALRLAENGISSLSQLGQLEIPGDGEQPAQTITINKATGQPLPRPELLGRGQRGLDINYNLVFNEKGQAIPYTSNRESSWMRFREDTLKPAAMFVGSILAGQALTGAFGGAGAAAGAATDAGFLAADAAQLAAQGLSEAQIASTLGSYGSTAAANLAASMAVNGLDVGMMTQQLDALSTNTGLLSQTGSNADFAAADALQLRNQVGNNFPAIEQNLIASGVDPLVAADISQQLAFNPGLTQPDLATNLSTSFGNNIYDVNMATTYPTSVLPGSGGLLSDVAGGGGVSTTTGANMTTGGSGLTASQIANLVSGGLSLAGATGAVRAATGGGQGGATMAPTQGVPAYSNDYFNSLQQYYNSYMPNQPRDVVSPLQSWYAGSGMSTGTQGMMPSSQGGGTAPQAAQATQPAAVNAAMGTGMFSAPTSNNLGDMMGTPMAANTSLMTGANQGVFRTVYDPRTGREFMSPAQAADYGVTDYVTEMPMKLEFLNETSRKAVTDAMAGGVTFEQAINNLGSKYNMSGKEFYNYEVQGNLRSRDSEPLQRAVATQSGGLKPDQLVAKLQEYKDNPPKTAQQFTEQQALYADYANRYANSSYNYANMGGKPQDFSLKPQDYLKTKFTGYSEPVNKLLSSMNQKTPTFNKVRNQLTSNPEIEKALSDIYSVDPKAPIFTAGNSNLEATINNLAGNISQVGKSAALRNFYGQQQNLIGFGGENWLDNQDMGNSQWAELQRKKLSFTPIANEQDWLGMAQRTSGARRAEDILRDPVSKRGVGVLIDERTGKPSGVAYYDRDGRMMNSSTFNKEDIYKNLEASGFDLSNVGAFGRILTSRGVGNDLTSVEADLSDVATPEWVDNQIKHLNWQNSVGLFESPSTTQARMKEIRKSHEMAKRLLSQRK